MIEIADLLRRKEQIDLGKRHSNGMISYDSWVVEAVEVLLKFALEELKRERKP